ncbi:hypothetical protein BU25DRAFT_488094 [Macroventuria anomochaeta]|uniref:Uncharacterized protein n=1 Tax=Macroventuria anomochaeta TaxID=301207 RepID=A0ACB6SB57_9PLEO|nr:uncharacterized protein BU25DRAFT_488094 [Macroventuria anomochaeta]KAF2631505.1 hypothetical protein BU25DRAFT_488094 [Macroventuria anomochaeta]
MAGSKTILTILRSFVFVGTVIVFVLGIWGEYIYLSSVHVTDTRLAVTIIQDINRHGEVVLATFRSRLGAEAVSWSQFIAEATQGTVRTWILVVTSSITALILLLIIVSNRYYWLRIPPTIVILLELTSIISTITVFGCAFSLSLSLKAFTIAPFPTLDSIDLSFFALLNPFSMALAITSALAGFLLIITFTANLLDFRKRRTRAKDTRSFEPTVSALGMSHGFHALHPQPRTTREPIPTVYDPYRAFRKDQEGLPSTKQVAFASEGAWMSRKHSNSRWSASTMSPRGIEGDIMRLLEVKRTRRAVPVRPTRPWSVMWNGREGTHVIY